MESRITHTHVLPPPLFHSNAHRALKATAQRLQTTGECNHTRKNKIALYDGAQREEEKTCTGKPPEPIVDSVGFKKGPRRNG